MSIVTELLEKPGVIAAGVYTYKSELSDYAGELPEDSARVAAVMCFATTTGANMESDMLAKFNPKSGIEPVRGWVLSGPQHTICVVANVFCFVDNQQGSLNQILGFMRRSLADKTMGLIQ